MSLSSIRPRRILGVWRGCVGILLLALIVSPLYSALAATPANDGFMRTWERSDKAVAEGRVSRTWMWGPEAFTPMMEESYADAPGGARAIQYFDKSRMEITDPNADPSTDWYVTNGLLVVELITGRMQVGDNQFEQRNPARVNVAGDADDPDGPTYQSFQMVLDVLARGEGAYVMERIDRDGFISEDSSLIARNVTADHYVAETGHTVAGPFWSFMNSEGLVYRNGQYLNDTLFPSAFYATGLPITEAYWAEVKVGGVARDVLIQCFERRCLTYTPDNPAGWQVEAGNVGQHYYSWRYDQDGGSDPVEDPSQGTAESYRYTGAWDAQAVANPALGAPVGVAIGPSGDVYISESGEDHVQRYTPGGILVTGWGELGDDTGQFNRPEGMATDADGNVYVADYSNDRIQIFDQYGVYRGSWGTSGAGEGELDGPSDIAIDALSQYAYVVDQLNARIQRFKLSDGSATVIASGYGSANGEFKSPNGLDLDDQNNIYVADTGNHRVQKFSFDGSYLGSFGTEVPIAPDLTYPRDVKIAPDGRIYVVNSGDQNGGASIRVWEPANDQASAYSFVSAWGESGSEPGQFDYPARIAMDADGYLYVTELRNNRIQVFSTDGALIDYWSDATRNAFGRPFGMDYADDGNLYVTDEELGQVKVLSVDGEFVRQWSDQLEHPNDIAVGDGYAYVVEQAQNKVLKFTTDGEYLLGWGSFGAADGEFDKPSSVAVDDDGYVYVVDSGNYRLQKFNSQGEFVAAWGSYGTAPGQFEGGKGIAVHGDALYVVEFFPGRVQKFDLDGNYLGEWGETGSEPGQLDGAYAVTTDAGGYVYVADRDNHRLQKFSADGELIAVLTPETAGMPEFSSPIGVAVSSDGTLFAVSDLLDGIMIFEPEAAN